MITLLPYLVCCGKHAHAFLHSLAFYLCAGSLLTDILSTLVHFNAGPEFIGQFLFQIGNLFLVISDSNVQNITQ